MTMQDYGKNIRRRLAALAVCTLLAVAVVAAAFLLATRNEVLVETGSYLDGFSRGVPAGMFSAFAVLMIVQMVRCGRALQNEERLRAMYVAEHDERKREIRRRMAELSCFFTAGALVVGVTAASFFSTSLAITLLAVLFVHVFFAIGAKLFFSQKY